MKMATALLVFILSILYACGNDALIETENTPVIEPRFYVVPSRVSNEWLKTYPFSDSIFIEANQNYRFYASYLIDNVLVTNESDYHKSILWKIEDQYFNTNNFQYTFTQPGQKDCFLEVIDLYGDTTKKLFTIFVNTPSSIVLNSPYNNYNQIEWDENQKLTLKWTTTGIDPWEKASCTIYAETNADSIWNNELGTTDCNKDIYLRGFIDEDKYYSELYWAVVLNVQSPNGRNDIDTSEVFHFSTKIKGNKNSYLTIPINYKNLINYSDVSTEILLISANNDTLVVNYNARPQGTVSTYVAPQTGLKIYARDSVLNEYVSKVQTIDIPEGSVIVADTLLFTDQVPPQAAPRSTKIKNKSFVDFNIYDDGSQINAKKLVVLLDDDTIPHFYEGTKISFNLDCPAACNLTILGEDYARNPFPQNHWFIKNKNDSLFITGPYLNEVK